MVLKSLLKFKTMKTLIKLVVNCKYDNEHVIYDQERQYFDKNAK